MTKEFTYIDLFLEMSDLAVYSFIEHFPAKDNPDLYNYDGTFNDKGRDLLIKRFTLLFSSVIESFDFDSVESISDRKNIINNVL